MVLNHLGYNHLSSKITKKFSPENINLSLFSINCMYIFSYGKYKEKLKVEFDKNKITKFKGDMGSSVRPSQ